MNQPTRLPTQELLALLRAFGVDEQEITRAEADGNLALLAIERLALGQELRYDLAAAAERTGLEEEELRHLWRSLGFPDPQPGELLFSDVDLGNFTAVAELIDSGVVSPEVTYGMTRVVGSSMARIASALVDAVTAGTGSAPDDEVTGGAAPRHRDEVSLPEVLQPVASEGVGFLPMFPDVLAQVWRRHLQAAARRRLLRGDADEAEGVVVGFADLVGFTAMAQQVTDEELARVVDRFEHLAYDVIVAGGGRVVKMIGDEVMFLVEDPVAAAYIALGLADASRVAAGLSDVRVGLAMGPVVEREGDAFGTTVNLASRATAIAYPGTVVVAPEVRDALADWPDITFRTMRPRFLKNIGRVSLAVMRRSSESPSSIRQSIEERRGQMRVALQQRLFTRPGNDGERGDGSGGADRSGGEA